MKVYKALFPFCKVFLLYICIYAPLYAQNTNLVPKDVYVGDEAEIRHSFAWNGNLFSADKEQSASMVNSSTLDESLNDSYIIKSMHIAPSVNGYVLSIIFVPWQVGVLDMPAFDLSTVFDILAKPLLIDIPEVYIQSIVEKTGETTMRPPTGPVIIPGTSYIVFGIIVAILLGCVCIIILLMRITAIKTVIKNFFRQIWASQNFRKTCRGLIILEKQSDTIDSPVFAATLSAIIRTYLKGRFAHPFTAATTSSLMGVFNTILAGTASDAAYDCMQDLYEVCSRCDFLQYAGIETEKAPLSTEEIHVLIGQTRSACIYFEKNDGSDEGKDA